MDARTTRERIADHLRDHDATPSDLSTTFEISREAAYSHVRHVAQSIEATGEQFLVRPPECRDCGFNDFDDPVNYPSRCPNCKSEAIREPAFRIATDEE